MRPIKFRAWDKLEKRMSTVKALYFDEESVRVTDSEYDIFPFSQFELMQFVGILDVRWVEIYEGDIVREYTDPNSGFWPENILYEIRYHWDSFMMYNLTLDTFVTNMNLRHLAWYYEVIGNVYENPELLK